MTHALNVVGVHRTLVRASSRDTFTAFAAKPSVFIFKDGKPAFTRFSWDVAGSCQSPIQREMYGRAFIDRPDYRPVGKPHQVANLTVRCRDCEACRNMRRCLWTNRAMAEIRDSTRTWFGTFTIDPTHRFKLRLQAIALFNKRGKAPKKGAKLSNPFDVPHPKDLASFKTFEELTEREQFRLIAAEFSKELTLYMKRIRKVSGAKLRFLLVAEEHETGDPHYHILIHERGAVQVSKATLQKQWRLGFTHFKLCEDKTNPEFIFQYKVKKGPLKGTFRKGSPTYLCKYLNKSALARVRASVRYGRTPQATATPEGIAPEGQRGENKPLQKGGGGPNNQSVLTDKLGNDSRRDPLWSDQQVGLVHVKVSDGLQITGSSLGGWLSKTRGADRSQSFDRGNLRSGRIDACASTPYEDGNSSGAWDIFCSEDSSVSNETGPSGKPPDPYGVGPYRH